MGRKAKDLSVNNLPNNMCPLNKVYILTPRTSKKTKKKNIIGIILLDKSQGNIIVVVLIMKRYIDPFIFTFRTQTVHNTIFMNKTWGNNVTQGCDWGSSQCLPASLCPYCHMVHSIRGVFQHLRTWICMFHHVVSSNVSLESVNVNITVVWNEERKVNVSSWGSFTLAVRGFFLFSLLLSSFFTCIHPAASI